MISLSVVSLNAPKITGQAMESIVTTAGPFGGSCSIYNSNGTELLTDFSVSCGERQSFTTISPSGRPLQATHPFAYKFEYSANNERFVLAYAGPLPFFSLRLPAGVVLVKVTVCSAFGFCNSACEFQLLLKLRQLPSLGFCFSLAKFASKICLPVDANLVVALLGSVSRFHQADIGLSVSYAGFSTGRLQIQLQFPAATGWVVPFDMNAVVNYRYVSAEHVVFIVFFLITPGF
uniref:REJ domain-containing protein n=1 Tax=Macrostomum lignano TaxID=282301 RepID=A0A1I8HNB1_9PLAT